MATANPFDLLGDVDNDDVSQLIAIHEKKAAAAVAVAEAAAAPKFPAKPVPPAQAVREAKNNNTLTARGGTGRGGAGRGRGGRGFSNGPNRDFGNGDVNGFRRSYRGSGGNDEGDGGNVKPYEREGGERGGYGSRRAPFRDGYGNGEGGGDDSERPPRRNYERHSGTGRGYEMKREGAGRGNWGTTNDDVIAQVTEENANTDEKVASPEKQPEQEDGPAVEADKDNKEASPDENKEKEAEDKEMTLDEYEKIKEEKRKALLALKAEERKVDIDKDFESMQLLNVKKGSVDDVLIKVGSEKDVTKKKDYADKEERSKKPMKITEFLKPAEGEQYYRPGGRGRGRGRGDRGSYGGGYRSGYSSSAPSIEDPGQFPTLGK